jgi:parvulin-like peptidyl-prolyl isomerase
VFVGTVAVAGVLATACTIPPSAATVNGVTISQSSVFGEMQSFGTTQAGACLLEIESQGGPLQVEGTGGQGTFSMSLTDSVLLQSVNSLLYRQYAAERHVTVTSAELSSARTALGQEFSGEIDAAVQQAGDEGVASYCQSTSGQPITGTQLLDALPAGFRDEQVRTEAVQLELLARGADFSPGAIRSYYDANPTQFTVACLSDIATATQSEAEAVAAKLHAGGSFAALAKADSIDTSSSANGGALGCTYELAELEQELGQPTITVGTPIGPIEDPSSSAWIIFEVTKATRQTLAAATPQVRQDLLTGTANETRVGGEVLAFARRSTVSVNPTFGTWHVGDIAPPAAPPKKDLLAVTSGLTGSSGTSATSGSSGTSATSGAGGTSG